MAPPRKHATAPRQGREFKLRIPEDIAARLETKARQEGRPQNRVIINELAEYPHLARIGDLAVHVKNMEVILARYGARITAADLADELLTAVDAVLSAEGPALPAAVERLRVTRSASRR